MTQPAQDAPEAPQGRAPGLFRFSIEGRRAPALFVAGWVATIVGAGLALEIIVAGGSGSGFVLVPLALVSGSIGLVMLGGSQAIERRAAGEPYAGPSPVLLFLAIVSITLLVAVILGVVLDLVGVSVDKPVGDLLTVAVQALVFIGVVRLMVVDQGAVTWREMGLGIPWRQAWRAMATGALFAIPVLVVTDLLAVIAVNLANAAPPAPLPPTGTTSGLVLHLAAGAGIAPIAEEIVFRGAALTAWLRTVGPRNAIIRSAILFAAAHAIGIGGTSFGEAASIAAVATVVRLPVALALGWVYLRTGTLWGSIATHATFNGLIILASELIPTPTALLLF